MHASTSVSIIRGESPIAVVKVARFDACGFWKINKLLRGVEKLTDLARKNCGRKNIV